MKSVMQHLFSQVPRAEIPRSVFDRSSGYKTTFNSGYLIPIFVDEALPGDSWKVSLNQFARLATPLVPVMDNMFCDSFFFFVPNRLIWDNWQKFNGEQDNPGDSTDYLVPQIMAGKTAAEGSLQDYMGIPTKLSGIVYNNLHMRAYNLIWNEWFRDQNLQDSITVDKGDGPDDPANYVLQKRGRRHDYFTSSLPWPQKGPAVTIPLGSKAPITSVDGSGNLSNQVFMTINGSVNHTSKLLRSTAVGNDPVLQSNPSHFAASDFGWPPVTDTVGYNYADLSNATAATINALRQAFQIQKMYERDARGGTRYTEILRAHFGVVSPDARLQRPEYLGGGSQQITVKPIPQTSATGVSGTPQGNLAAMGIMTGSGNGFTKSFTEHGVLLGMIMVRADQTYQQGLDRMWSRQTRFDFYWPALGHIGEQTVLNQEIYAQATSDDFLVFGYQERYAEYRYKKSYITGQFRSNATTPLDIWHLAIDYGSLPSLNDTFIQDSPPISRIIAVPSEPEFLYDAYIQAKVARPMSTYGVPGNIDRF